MADDLLIRAEGVGKKFCRNLKTSLKYGVMDLAGEVFGKPRTHDLRPKEFWAVDDVGFELRRGESLALIGHNGAGKTTLLKMLNGLIKPDRGRVEMHGSVGAMIALGAGFNPILTGRENIYINASVLGLSKATVDRRLEEVIEFSEIGKFIDSPVRNYSSGMNVRLGFSVAALLLRPDILLLDEVLAVGDLPFRIKCLNLMRSIMQDCAVIFVSHNMPTVSNFCNRAILMGHGRIISDPGEEMASVLRRYVALTPIQDQDEGNLRGVNSIRFFQGSEPVTEPVMVRHGGTLELDAELSLAEETEVSLLVLAEGTLALVQYRLGDDSTQGRMFRSGKHRIRINMGLVDLSPSRYSVDVIFKSARKEAQRLYYAFYIDVDHNVRTWHHMMRAAPVNNLKEIIPVDH